VSEKVIVIFGPTSSGKTALSFEVANYLRTQYDIECEIISADSRQVYRGMNVGTAKVTSSERKKYVHHFISIISPAKQYTSKQFSKEAKIAITKIHERGNMPLIVGGTGTYVMGLVGGNHLNKASSLEVSYSSLLLVPEFSRHSLYRKIEANIDQIFQDGLYNEVKNLINAHHAVPKQIGKTHGYREFVEYAKQHNKNVFRLNSNDLEKIKQLIKEDTKKYAMHQSGWLLKMKNYHVIRGIAEAKPLVDIFLKG
jgi:tRNA A37 N6-isopentenylltransferase MiaA